MKNSYTNLQMPRFIQILTLISLMLAYRLIDIQQGWITDDFVLYHEVSRLFSIGDIKAGLKLYNWPLYPALIAVIHKLTTLSLTASAQTLTVAFTPGPSAISTPIYSQFEKNLRMLPLVPQLPISSTDLF